MQVLVRDNNVDQALRVLKKKMQREGIFREMKARQAYEKPSEKRAREKAEAVRRSVKVSSRLPRRRCPSVQHVRPPESRFPTLQAKALPSSVRWK